MPLRQRAVDLGQGLFRLTLRLSVDQVGDPLGLGEVELAVLKGAPREFARIGRAQAQIDQRLLQGLNDRDAAMQVKLAAILAGVAVGAGEPQHQGFVDLVAAVGQRPQAGPARRRHLSRQDRNCFT